MRRAKRFRQNRGIAMKAIEHDCASRETLRLSAHEIATPLLLLHASVDLIAATPDVISLWESELVHLVESDQGQTMFTITDKGNAVLRILDARATTRPHWESRPSGRDPVFRPSMQHPCADAPIHRISSGGSAELVLRLTDSGFDGLFGRPCGCRIRCISGLARGAETRLPEGNNRVASRQCIFRHVVEPGFGFE